jgi:hypothetical protein
MKRDERSQTLRVGTIYFESYQAALEYHRPMHYPDTARAISRMLANGEIRMGKPPLGPGDKLHLHPDERRYYIVHCPDDSEGDVEPWDRMEFELDLIIYLPKDFGMGYEYKIENRKNDGLGVIIIDDYRNHATDALQRVGCAEIQVDMEGCVLWVKFKVHSTDEIGPLKERIYDVITRFPVKE